MDRREFLISSGAAVAAASPAAAQTEAASVLPASRTGTGTLLRLSMAWADAPHGPADSARRLARRIEQMTDGRYRIEVYTAADGTSDAADLVHGSAHDFSSLHPAFAYFAGLPGSAGLAPQDLAHWIAVGGGQMLWDDLAGRHGWKPLLAGHSGDAPPLWSRQPINGLADLAGQRLAAPGLGADVARALGAEALEAPVATVGALADGSVFAVEAGGLATSLASGIAALAPHATGQGLNGHGTALALHVRRALWDRLSESDRAIFAAAAAEEFQLAFAEERAHTGLARRVLEAKGVRFAPWPADIADALDRVAEATIAHVAGRDDLALRIDQSYMAFRSLLSGTPAPRRSPAIV
jgi:TRAP-type mannitol/chloroaromatic compound transport system substrate-binding protein